MKQVALVVGTFLTWSWQVGAEPLTHVRLDVEEAARVATELGAAGFDVLEGSVKGTSLELVVSARGMAALVARGFKPVTLAVGRPFRELDRERQLQALAPTGYPSLSEILAQLDATVAAHPAIARVVDLTATFGVPPTAEGRHLHAVKISDNVAENEDEPTFLIVSNHHARELVTPVIALDAIDRLTSGYGSDPTLTSLVDTHQIWIAPVWNPDGYEYVFNVDNLWRKNRRVLGGDVGVDLNRNYPQGWDAACAGDTAPSSDSYKGPSPASEAETQTMIAWSEELRFAKVLDYHSAGREVLYAYNCLAHPWEAFLRAEAEALSIESSYGGAVRRASAEGEHYQWQFAQKGSHAFLTETALEWQPSYASALREAARVWPGTLWLLQRPVPLSGHVRDACSGEPVVASITHPGVSFSNGERNTSFEPFGRYHAFLPPGDHVVQFSAPGYATETRTVSVTDRSAEIVEVELVPSAGCPPVNLSITKSDGQTTASPGSPRTYTIVATNTGPNAATGATVTDIVPASLTRVTWSCVGAGGGTCTASGSGNINDTVNLPVGASVTYTLSGTVAMNPSGLVNTATVAVPSGMADPNPANNTATDEDLLLCFGEKVVVPDGRVSTDTIGASATNWFVARLQSGSSYSLELKNTTRASTVPGTLTVFSGADGCSGTSTLSVLDTATVDPTGGAGLRRVSFTAPATGSYFRARLVNSSGSAIPYSFSWSETTLFAAAWTTSASFDTYYSFQNTTNTTRSGTLTFRDTAGAIVTTAPVTVPAGQTTSVNTQGQSVTRNRTGTVRFTHDGPPGSVQAEAAIANFTISPAYIQPVRFLPVREAR